MRSFVNHYGANAIRNDPGSMGDIYLDEQSCVEEAYQMQTEEGLTYITTVILGPDIGEVDLSDDVARFALDLAREQALERRHERTLATAFTAR